MPEEIKGWRKQVLDAQKIMSDWTVGKAETVRLEGTDEFAKCRTCKIPDAGLCGQCWD